VQVQLCLREAPQAVEIHVEMIGAVGRRRAAIAIGLVLAVGIGFGLRSGDAATADPPGAAARADRLAEAARIADAALLRLDDGLEASRDHARRGTALTVSGDAPAPELEAAADLLVAAADDADAAQRSLAALAGYAAAVQPGTAIPALSYGGADVQQIAAQLRAGVAAATLFVQRRHATEAIVESLGAALAALDRDDPAAALSALDAADAPLALLDDWEDRPALLRYWITVSRDLIAAAGDIARATIANDPAAVEAAAARYAKAADLARGADNALAFTLSEEGSAVSATPLRRLAEVADQAVDSRAAIRPLLQPGS
jgi:hypothetical protein